MTLTQLEYIVAIDTHRHFATAAKKCYITQPTLSMQVQKLEEELGLKIFDRSKQPVVPTEAGQEIIHQARVILAESRKMFELVQEQQNVLSGELRIAIIPTLAPYLLPRFVGNFMRKYPDVKLVAEELQSSQIITALVNETIDAGILVTPLNEPGIEEHPVFYEEFVVYTSPHLPLFKQATVQMDHLPSGDMWLLKQGHCFRNQMENLCKKHDGNQGQQFSYESGSLETLKKLVEQERGFTLLPELATNDIPVQYRERLKPFEDPRPVREVSIVIHRTHLKRRLIELLKNEISNAIPEKMRRPRENVVAWR